MYDSGVPLKVIDRQDHRTGSVAVHHHCFVQIVKINVRPQSCRSYLGRVPCINCHRFLFESELRLIFFLFFVVWNLRYQILAMCSRIVVANTGHPALCALIVPMHARFMSSASVIFSSTSSCSISSSSFSSWCLSLSQLYLSQERLNYARAYLCKTVCRKASATEISTFCNNFNKSHHW